MGLALWRAEMAFHDAIYAFGSVPGNLNRELDSLILDQGMTVSQALDAIGC